MAVLQTCSVTWVAETVVLVPGAVQVDESPGEHGQEVVGQDLDPGVDPEMSSAINLQPTTHHTGTSTLTVRLYISFRAIF